MIRIWINELTRKYMLSNVKLITEERFVKCVNTEDNSTTFENMIGYRIYVYKDKKMGCISASGLICEKSQLEKEIINAIGVMKQGNVFREYDNIEDCYVRRKKIRDISECVKEIFKKYTYIFYEYNLVTCVYTKNKIVCNSCGYYMFDFRDKMCTQKYYFDKKIKLNEILLSVKKLNDMHLKEFKQVKKIKGLVLISSQVNNCLIKRLVEHLHENSSKINFKKFILRDNGRCSNICQLPQYDYEGFRRKNKIIVKKKKIFIPYTTCAINYKREKNAVGNFYRDDIEKMPVSKLHYLIQKSKNGGKWIKRVKCAIEIIYLYENEIEFNFYTGEFQALCFCRLPENNFKFNTKIHGNIVDIYKNIKYIGKYGKYDKLEQYDIKSPEIVIDSSYLDFI